MSPEAASVIRVCSGTADVLVGLCGVLGGAEAPGEAESLGEAEPLGEGADDEAPVGVPPPLCRDCAGEPELQPAAAVPRRSPQTPTTTAPRH